MINIKKSEYTPLGIAQEIAKYRMDPYLFCTKFITVDGKPFATGLNKTEFNSVVFQAFNSDEFKENLKKVISQTIMDF
jgi:hypothetical protein